MTSHLCNLIAESARPSGCASFFGGLLPPRACMWFPIPNNGKSLPGPISPYYQGKTSNNNKESQDRTSIPYSLWVYINPTLLSKKKRSTFYYNNPFRFLQSLFCPRTLSTFFIFQDNVNGGIALCP